MHQWVCRGQGKPEISMPILDGRIEVIIYECVVELLTFFDNFWLLLVSNDGLKTCFRQLWQRGIFHACFNTSSVLVEEEIQTYVHNFKWVFTQIPHNHLEIPVVLLNGVNPFMNSVTFFASIFSTFALILWAVILIH